MTLKFKICLKFTLFNSKGADIGLDKPERNLNFQFSID